MEQLTLTAEALQQGIEPRLLAYRPAKQNDNRLDKPNPPACLPASQPASQSARSCTLVRAFSEN